MIDFESVVMIVQTVYGFFESLLFELNSVEFGTSMGFNAGLVDVMMGFLILSFAISMLWRGARG